MSHRDEHSADADHAVVRERYELTVPEIVAGPNEPISTRTPQYEGMKYSTIKESTSQEETYIFELGDEVTFNESAGLQGRR